MNRSLTELKVGLFVLASLGAIVYMLFFLSPEIFNGSDSSIYFTEVNDASGIVMKTHVRTNGVIVGKVKNVKLLSDRTRLDLEVDSEVRVPKGSVVAIKGKGLLGDVFIEIVRATDNGDYIESGQFIPPDENQVNISDLMALAGKIGKQVSEVTTVLSTHLGGGRGERNFKEVVENIVEISRLAKEVMEKNAEDISKTVGNLEGFSSSLKRIVSDREKSFATIVQNTKAVTEDLAVISARLSAFAKDNLGNGDDSLSKMVRSVEKSIENVESISDDIKQVAAKIDSGQGTLGKLINDDKPIKEVEKALTEIREVLSPARKLQVIVDYHGELRDSGITQHYFNTFLRTRPDKFFILGVTDVRETTKKIERTTSTNSISQASDAVSTKKDETIFESEVVSEAIKFNVQFGKRWGDLQLRFGLFETTGGVASDLFFFKDHLKVSFEAFNWNEKNIVRSVAQFKASLRFNFYKHLYVVGGFNDLSKYREGTREYSFPESAFIGAGLHFKDNDLKAVLGTAAAAL